jgi:multidrug efflux pump subunit AcrB
VKTRINRISSFPDEIEPPDVSIPDSNQWFDVIKIAVCGDMEEEDLLRAARTARDDFIAMKGISQANVLGNSPLEIAVEADPRRLRDFGLTFADLSEAIRRSSVDLPAGRIVTDEGSLTIRSKGQAYTRADFENIVISNSLGSEVKLGSVAKVSDGYEESTKIMRFNGQPCLLIEVLRLGDENALEIANSVKGYVASAHERFPEGVSLFVWDDSSEELEGRLGTLLTSMLQGGLLVLIVLGLFLRPIPVAFAGGLIVMPWVGLSANVMSIFGFIIVIGLVVDDAIVTAENVYIKLQEGMDPLEAATEGTMEVATPVTFGVITTIVAFVPLMFFDGFYGAFAKQIAPIVSAVLIFSLIESKLALPCHLKYVKVHRKKLNRFERCQKRIAGSLEVFVGKFYDPSLRFATRHRYITLALFFAVGMASIGYFSSGKTGFVNMPSIDRNRIMAMVRMPTDTQIAGTEERTSYVADHEETKKRSIYGGIALFIALYALLAIPFRSLYQPLFVMLAVPFGAIGALFGHLIMDITPSYLSIFGILALCGVVVNDSLVMVDFINQKVRAGMDLREAVIQSGTRRFRPIFLTSATTFAGLMPLIFDRSLQAQLLIPMAVSLAFGILFATVITLYLIPSAYLAAEEIRAVLRKGWLWWRYPNGKPTPMPDAELEAR